MSVFVGTGVESSTQTYSEPPSPEVFAKAIDNADAEAVRSLIRAGANVNDVRKPFDKFRPLEMAVRYITDAGVVRALVAGGADVNTWTRMPLLLWAMYDDEEHVAALNILLDAKADVNSKSPDGETVLGRALYTFSTDHVDLIAKILRLGANPNDKTLQTWTGDHVSPLEYAMAFSNFKHGKEIIELLIQTGADPQKWEKAPPLFLALYKDKQDLVKVFLDAGASLNDVDKEERNIFLYAIHKGAEVSTVKRFLEMGFSPNTHDVKGTTPVMACLKYRNNLGEPHQEMQLQEILKLLIERGADVNAQDKSGLTALIYATPQLLRDPTRQIEAMRILIAAGADVKPALNYGPKELWVRLGVIDASSGLGFRASLRGLLKRSL
jgi:ankyrin repeat protein